jgi:hypothetical protein
MKKCRYYVCRGSGWAPEPAWTFGRREKCHFFVFSYTLYFIRTYFFVLIVLHFALCVFTYITHKQPCRRWDSNPGPSSSYPVVIPIALRLFVSTVDVDNTALCSCSSLSVYYCVSVCCGSLHDVTVYKR